MALETRLGGSAPLVLSNPVVRWSPQLGGESAARRAGTSAQHSPQGVERCVELVRGHGRVAQAHGACVRRAAGRSEAPGPSDPTGVGSSGDAAGAAAARSVEEIARADALRLRSYASPGCFYGFPKTQPPLPRFVDAGPPGAASRGGRL